MLRSGLLGLVVVLLSACGGKATLEKSRVEYVTVEGRRFEVRTAATGVPEEYRLLVVRATLVVDPDPDRESKRDWVVAGQAMERTCGGRPYQVLENAFIDKVNLQLRFRCQA